MVSTQYLSTQYLSGQYLSGQCLRCGTGNTGVLAGVAPESVSRSHARPPVATLRTSIFLALWEEEVRALGG